MFYLPQICGLTCKIVRPSSNKVEQRSCTMIGLETWIGSTESISQTARKSAALPHFSFGPSKSQQHKDSWNSNEPATIGNLKKGTHETMRQTTTTGLFHPEISDWERAKVIKTIPLQVKV